MVYVFIKTMTSKSDVTKWWNSSHNAHFTEGRNYPYCIKWLKGEGLPIPQRPFGTKFLAVREKRITGNVDSICAAQPQLCKILKCILIWKAEKEKFSYMLVHSPTARARSGRSWDLMTQSGSPRVIVNDSTPSTCITRELGPDVEPGLTPRPSGMGYKYPSSIFLLCLVPILTPNLNS